MKTAVITLALALAFSTNAFAMTSKDVCARKQHYKPTYCDELPVKPRLGAPPPRRGVPPPAIRERQRERGPLDFIPEFFGRIVHETHSVIEYHAEPKNWLNFD